MRCEVFKPGKVIKRKFQHWTTPTAHDGQQNSAQYLDRQNVRCPKPERQFINRMQMLSTHNAIWYFLMCYEVEDSYAPVWGRRESQRFNWVHGWDGYYGKLSMVGWNGIKIGCKDDKGLDMDMNFLSESLLVFSGNYPGYWRVGCTSIHHKVSQDLEVVTLGGGNGGGYSYS